MNVVNNIFSSGGHYSCGCSICPDFVWEQMIKEGNEEQKNIAIKNLELSNRFRAVRELTRGLPRPIFALSAENAKNRTIYTMNNSEEESDLPGDAIMHEGDDEGGHDEDTIKCYRNADIVYSFFEDNFGRISIDDNGYPLNLSVHFGSNFGNAFWAPWSLSWAFGEGADGLFKAGRMTDASVVFHEYQHGVTQYTSQFRYRDEAGGLNESMSDVFSAICEQKMNNQGFEQASWLIGDGIMEDDVGKALRSMEDPGNKSKSFKWDKQIQHYDNFNPSMNPHVCSGIPNKAFYLACKEIGGFSWEKPGKIWYQALTSGARPFCTFKEFGDLTLTWAKTLYGTNEARALENAWSQVGITVEGVNTRNMVTVNAKFRKAR